MTNTTTEALADVEARIKAASIARFANLGLTKETADVWFAAERKASEVTGDRDRYARACTYYRLVRGA